MLKPQNLYEKINISNSYGNAYFFRRANSNAAARQGGQSGALGAADRHRYPRGNLPDRGRGQRHRILASERK